MLELFEKLNEKQKRLAIAYIRALLSGVDYEDERMEEENGAIQSQSARRG